MSRMVDIQNASSAATLPEPEQIEHWVNAALDGRRDAVELTVRIVDEIEARELNFRYRDRDYATNVLSFPVGLPDEVDSDLLGDIVICAAVVEREAAEQGKTLEAHWAHLVIHGCLHLLGFDHQHDDEAETMEKLETGILARLGYPDPYHTE